MELETLALGLILGGISGSIGVLYILVRLDWVKGMIYDTITGYVSQLLEETFKKPEGLALSLKPLMMKLTDDKELWRSFKPGVMMLVDEIGGQFPGDRSRDTDEPPIVKQPHQVGVVARRSAE